MAVYRSTSVGGPAAPSVADATDYDDALDILISVLTRTATITAPNTQLPAIEEWTVNKDDTTSVPGERFVYLEGPGLAGTDAIFINIRRYNSGLAFNWEIRASSGFNTSETFENQPGMTPIRSFYTLSNAGMPFWIISNGRRFMCIFKASISYHACYGGFYLPYATPTENPYPIFAGGNAVDEDLVFTQVTYDIGNFYDGPTNQSLSAPSCSHIRHVDGTWHPVGAFSPDDSRGNFPSTSTILVGIWPHIFVTASDGLYMDTNSDGATQSVMPFVLTTIANDGVTYGELDGVFFVPTGILTPEDTVTINGDVYVTFPNVYRSEENNVAFLLE